MQSRVMILHHFVALLLVVCSLHCAAGSDTAVRYTAFKELKRKQIANKLDTHRLRETTHAVVEQSQETLRVPDPARGRTGFTVAKEPCRFEFVLVPLEPRYFYEPLNSNYDTGLWSSWGQGTYHPATGKFYAALGNHAYYDAQIHITEYDPSSQTIRTSPNFNAVLGRGPLDFGDGKIHGKLDFYDGNQVWFMTYWCKYPEPTEAQYSSGYEGGKLLSYNVLTGELIDHGVPLRRTSWPLHRMDTNRGLMFAVGQFREFLCYDVANKKTLWAGHPGRGMTWYDRALLVDEETGCAYSSNAQDPLSNVHMIKYDSARNRFTRMNSVIPHVDYNNESDQLRAWTPRKTRDGWFYCISRGGRLFRFHPERDRLEDLGLCWPGEVKHLYTASMDISPDDKYVYYVPGSHGGSHRLGTPIVQFNTQTHEMKALAFLFPYLYDKYGYIASGTYSVCLDDKGERLFILFNGAFNKFDPEGGDVFGDPSVIVVHIPESERR